MCAPYGDAKVRNYIGIDKLACVRVQWFVFQSFFPSNVLCSHLFVMVSASFLARTNICSFHCIFIEYYVFYRYKVRLGCISDVSPYHYPTILCSCKACICIVYAFLLFVDIWLYYNPPPRKRTVFGQTTTDSSS